MIENMLSLASRLVQTDIVSNPSKHLEDEAVAAGRKAEKQVEELLVNLGWMPSYNVFHSLRIPNGMQTGRREIDLVVLTDDTIFCLEVKNWSGTISRCSDNVYWQQKVANHSRRDKGKFIQHICPIRSIKEKTSLLRSHLSRGGIFIAESRFVFKVILVNVNGRVCERIATSDAVVTHERLNAFATKFAKPYSAYLIDPLVPAYFRGQFSYAQMEQIRAVLNLVGTWDVLELHGGKVLHGDFKGCAEIKVERKNVDTILFTHQRNKAAATFWAVLGYSPSTTATLQKRGHYWWFGKETVGTVAVPFNRDVSFRVAGSAVDSRVPCNDINKVFLSC